ncbi:MAG: ubiquinone/menaquinone biosynthesis methyltransferase [Deltaproteobacteria bacterium]|nr:ubiquinone/menaquinone biosynthesis methyltransferase [Deltaproteobacteria bacterium]
MEKREFVRRSFASIAVSYDLLNTLLSFCLDRWWRREAVKVLGHLDKGLVLDACAGTMRLGKNFLRRWPKARVLALDFSLEMLRGGIKRTKNSSIIPVCGDAEGLPFRDETFDRVAVGFGVRNLEDPQRGVEELFRVLKRGGRLVILEFGRPTLPVFKDLYRWYLSRVIPWIGGLISRQKETYRYLHDSIMAFYELEELVAVMKKAGFSQIRCRELTLGIANLYIGEK